MKFFFSFLVSCSLLSSILLYTFFNYTIKTLSYHLLFTSILISILFSINILLITFFNKSKRLYYSLTIVNLIFSLCYFSIFLLVFGSNYFWKKTISINILKNYIFSFNGILSILPIQLWISYSLLVLLLLILISIFIVIKPKEKDYNKFYNSTSLLIKKKRISIISVLLISSIILFNENLLKLKRNIQFSEEPFSAFLFGPIWAGEHNNLAFDKARYLLGLRDKSCIENITKSELSTEKNIVIILLDALRSDHLSINGYERNTTPFIDSLYKNGDLVKIANSFSTSNNTIGGIAGLFFSKDWENFGFNGLSLMKYCKLKGMSTYAFLTGFHRDWFGLSALYRENCDYYYESANNPIVQDDNDMVTLQKIENTKIKANSFIFFHLLSTHTIGTKNEQFKKYFPDKIGINISTKTALTNNYDNGILQGDFIIRSIFNKLKKDNLLENSIIYIVGDHGELLGENGRWSHGGDMHEILLNVPILIYDKNTSWYKNKEFATLKDVAPTITDRLFKEIPSCWEGKSLHTNAQNITIKTNSVVDTEIPNGKINYLNGIISVDFFDKKGKLKIQSLKTDSGWKRIK